MITKPIKIVPAPENVEAYLREPMTPGEALDEALLSIATDISDGGKAVLPSRHAMLGFRPSLSDKVADAYTNLVTAYLGSESTPYYGILITVPDGPTVTTAVRVAAALRLGTRLTSNYSYITAAMLPTMNSSGKAVSVNLGTLEPKAFSLMEVITQTGIMHIGGDPNMSSYAQTIASGVVLQVISAGGVVILEGGEFEVASTPRLSSMTLDTRLLYVPRSTSSDTTHDMDEYDNESSRGGLR